MKRENKKAVFHTTEVIVLIILTCFVSIGMGFFIGNRSNNILPSGKSDEHIEEFLNNYQYIMDNYYGDIDSETLMDGALSGMLEVLGDDYSTVIDEQSFDAQLQGNYEGLGVQIYKAADGNIYVLSVFENSPAEKAGIFVGDIIVSIDGKNYKDKLASDITNYIFNSKSNVFTFVISRDGEEHTLTLKRGSVIIPSVESKVIEQSGKKIGYIYIDIFANATASQFSNALKDLESKNIYGLIIDVRGNSGGHLTTVVDILSNFLDNKNVIYQTETKGKVAKFYSKGKVNKKYPIVILQNGQSASASELLSVSLKEQYGATVVGEASYGKGTVQEVVTSGDTEYKFTTKKWLSPKGNWINEVGVTPDINVTLNDVYYNDPTDANDNQLQTAINELLK